MTRASPSRITIFAIAISPYASRLDSLSTLSRSRVPSNHLTSFVPLTQRDTVRASGDTPSYAGLSKLERTTASCCPLSGACDISRNRGLIATAVSR